MKKLFALFIVLTLAVLFCTPCFSQSQSETLRVLMDIGDDTVVLNPYTASDSNSIVIMLNLYDGLFEYDSATSEPTPALAKTYSVSDDGLQWTFGLRKARFSDGSDITAQTFIDSWSYMVEGPLGSNLDIIRRNSDGSLDIFAPEPYTLVVNLNSPVPYLPSLLCQPCLAAIKDTSTYSGAYKLITQGEDGITLRRNAYYWDNVGCDFVEILFDTNLAPAFLDGDIHWSMAAIEEASDFMVLSKLYATTFFYFSAKDGAYANENIRKALVSIIPWDIIRSRQGSLMESSSLVPESQVKASIPENVRELLSEGGYPYGEKALPMIRLATTRGSQNAAASEFIASLWSAVLGVTVTISTVPLTVYATDPAQNPYDFCTITWIGDYFDPMAFLSLFESTGSFNLANFSNAEYDSLLEMAKNAGDELTRQSLLSQAEKLLLDSAVVIPMSTAFATNFVRSDIIEGWKANVLDIHLLKDISFIKSN